MQRSWKIARLLGPCAVILGTGLSASPALASSSAGQAVTGTTLSALSLAVGTPAAFATGFSPGGSPTATGTLTAADTSPSWTLTALDSGTGHGKMVSAGTGCTGSDATLTNPVDINVTSVLPGVTSAGALSLTGSAQTFASASNQLLSAAALTTAYTLTIPSSQVMLTGCVYSLTTTFTLQ